MLVHSIYEELLSVNKKSKLPYKGAKDIKNIYHIQTIKM